MPDRTAYYFPHESNFKDRAESIAVLEELGAAGYGTIWIIKEVLRDMPGYRASAKILPGIARRFNLDMSTVNRIIEDYDLFQTDENGDIYSPYLCEKMESIDAKRKRLREAAAKGNEVRWGSPPESPNNRMAIASGSHGDRMANPVGIRSESQGKERKEEKSNSKALKSNSKNNYSSGINSGHASFSDEDPAMHRAKYFHSLLVKVHGAGAIKEPNWQKWAGTMDKIFRIDKRDPEKTKALIIAIFKDPFWSKNVLSPDKLREKYDELTIKLAPGSVATSQETPTPAYATKITPE